MLNSRFLTMGNIAMICIFTVITHVAARPLYNIVDKKGDNSNG